MAGQVGAAGIGSYVASKHAVIGLTRTAAREHSDLRINAVAPGTFMALKAEFTRQLLTHRNKKRHYRHSDGQRGRREARWSADHINAMYGQARRAERDRNRNRFLTLG